MNSDEKGFIIKLEMKNTQSGQVVIILLLVIVIALAIGLSISTRSLNEISTATKTEQSTRAYSAAEAGIEKGLQDLQSNITGSRSVSGLTNEADSQINTTPLLPTEYGQSIEYGVNGIGKDEVAQFWLADPANNLSAYYNRDSFEIYFGNPGQTVSADNPAVEVIVVTLVNGAYTSKRYYFDSYKSTSDSRGGNGFDKSCSFVSSSPINTILSSSSTFYCRATVSGYKSSSSDVPVMARVRMLYSSPKQKVALKPTLGCADINQVACMLPPQIRLISSVGSSGSVQRRLLLFKQDYVIPHFFDYVLFSASDITK